MRKSIILSLLMLAAARSTHAQLTTPVTWSVRAASVSALEPGTEARVTVVAVIARGWNMYSLSQKPGGPIALSITVPAGEPFAIAGTVNGPTPAIKPDDTFDVPIELYSDTARFTVPLKLTKGTSGAVLEGRLTTRFQMCSETTCLPPRTVTLPVRLQRRSEVVR